jgi:AAA ATPase domain
MCLFTKSVLCIATEISLDDLAYAEGARYDPERQCLPGTREEILREITDWINSTDSLMPRMFVLSGVAGSGKSSIAHTIARLFDGVGRLGSSFCFDRNNQAKLRPDMFFSTIARDLADLDRQRKQALWHVVKEKTALRKTRAPREQFDHFILKPAVDLTTIGPIVIVIDAFDESGDEASRRVILSILANRISELPPNLRVLVTTRRESDIDKAFDNNPHVHCKLMDTIDTNSTNNDITAFIRDSLADVTELDEKWPNQSWCELLVLKSEALFQWASTACRFIKGDGEHGVYPTERLANLLALSPLSKNVNHLDQLYLGILTRLFPAGNHVAGLNRFKLVVGRILVAVEPLSLAPLRELCKEDDSINVVELIIKPMGSLFNGVGQPLAPIRPLHSSLRDFLADPGRSGRFYIDVVPHQRTFALACLRVMELSLKFNICQLETSYLLNSEVHDLASRIEEHIPTHLSYSCRFWTRHLQGAAYDIETLSAVKNFLWNRTLYWLEVLSLMRDISTASKSLSSLSEWSRVGVRLCNKVVSI